LLDPANCRQIGSVNSEKTQHLQSNYWAGFFSICLQFA